MEYFESVENERYIKGCGLPKSLLPPTSFIAEVNVMVNGTLTNHSLLHEKSPITKLQNPRQSIFVTRSLPHRYVTPIPCF